MKFAVAGNVLKEGELVPSVRELARELTINPNTVARAYRQLQDDGVLNSVRGTGLAVAAGAGQRCREERVELIRARLEQVFAEARQSRIDPAQAAGDGGTAIGQRHLPSVRKLQGEMIMPPIIRLDKLTKRFGAETALDGVSLEVPPGVVFALLGENGAGKTTAIRIMLGLAEPTPARPKCWATAAPPQGCKSASGSATCPNGPRSTSG